MSTERHRGKPWSEYTLSRTQPDWQREKEAEKRHREADARFVRALAEAIMRGDHLPAGVANRGKT